MEGRGDVALLFALCSATRERRWGTACCYATPLPKRWMDAVYGQAVRFGVRGGPVVWRGAGLNWAQEPGAGP